MAKTGAKRVSPGCYVYRGHVVQVTSAGPWEVIGPGLVLCGVRKTKALALLLVDDLAKAEEGKFVREFRDPAKLQAKVDALNKTLEGGQ